MKQNLGYRVLIFCIAMFPALAEAQLCFSCGDGKSGDFHAFTDTILPSGTYNFNSFIIEVGKTVKISGNSALIIRSRGVVSIKGILDASGQSGSDGKPGQSNGIGGVAVAGGNNGGNGSFSVTTILNGVSGFGPGSGGFGYSLSGGGGAGYATSGFNSGSNSGKGGTSYGTSNLSVLLGGSGGGGGSGGYNAGGGGGGAGGGIISIFSCDEIYIGLKGSILTNGGNGGSDGNGNCGAGGGGSGGIIWLSSRDVTVDGIVSAIGGNGGTSLLNTSLINGNGGNGSSGRIRIDADSTIIHGLVNPSSEYSENPFIAQIFRKLDSKCFGSSTGYAKVRCHGGKSPLSFQWSNGINTRENKNLTAGTYTVTITDANGCKQNDQVLINEPLPIIPSVISEPPSCADGSDGYIFANAKGGLPFPALRSLTTATQFYNSTQRGIMFDLYTNKTIVLNSISMGFISNDSVNIKIWCKQGSYRGFENDSTAWICLGTFKLKSNGSEANTVINIPGAPSLSKGAYSFYIYNLDSDIKCLSTAALGNKYIFDHILTMFEGIGKSYNSTPFSSVNSTKLFFSGSINYTIPGTDANLYLFKWDNTIPGKELYNISAGEHLLTVTDAIGCEQNHSINVNASDKINIQTTQTKQPTCPLKSDGLIEVNSSGGNLRRTLVTSFNADDKTKGLFFEIQVNSPIRFEQLKLLIADTATVSVYLKSGSFAGFENNQPAWTCLGTSFYQNTIQGLPVNINLNSPLLNNGLWSIYICSAGSKIGTLSPANPSNTNANSSQVSILKGEKVNYNNDPFNSVSTGLNFFAGSFGYTISGINQFDYLWNNNSTGATINNLGSGKYTVTVTDIGGCSRSLEVDLKDPEPVHINSSVINETDSLHNGSAFVSASGGKAPYYYFWPSTQQTGPGIENVPAGKYPLLIVDANGCSNYETLEILRISTPKPETGILVLEPNPTSNFIKISKDVNGMNACRMIIYNDIGQIVLSEETTISTLQTEGLNLQYLTDGPYILSVSDQDQHYSTRFLIIR